MIDQVEWVSARETYLCLSQAITSPSVIEEMIAKAVLHGVAIRAVRGGDILPDHVDVRRIQPPDGNDIYWSQLRLKTNNGFTADFVLWEFEWHQFDQFVRAQWPDYFQAEASPPVLMIAAEQPTKARRRRGPEPGVSRYGKSDQDLFVEMKALIPRAGSAHAAALQLATEGKVAGTGTPESRARRLAKAYKTGCNSLRLTATISN